MPEQMNPLTQTRRQFFKSVVGLGAVAAFSRFFSACSDPSGLAGEGYRVLVQEQTLQKGGISQLGPLSVRLAGVVVENPYKDEKRADVEFLKSDNTPYLTWGFNLNDQKTDIQLPGGSSASYAVECIGLPEFGSTDEWVKLKLWKKSG